MTSNNQIKLKFVACTSVIFIIIFHPGIPPKKFCSGELPITAHRCCFIRFDNLSHKVNLMIVHLSDFEDNRCYFLYLRISSHFIRKLKPPEI